MKRNFLFLAFLLSASMLSINTAFSAISPSNGQGIAYYRAGFPQVAKPLLISEIETDSATRPETCFTLGNIYFADNKPDSAGVTFMKGLAANPFNSLNKIGLTMLKIKSNPTEAETEFKDILKLKQNKKNVDIYLAIANAYLFNGVLDQAVVYQELAKNIKTKYAPVYVVLGDIELAKKNVGEACKNYEQALYFDDMCKEAYIKYARAYKNVNSPLAIEKLNRLKEKEPSFLLADRELANIYYDNNNYKKAAELYENYLKSGNSNVLDLTKYAFTLFLGQDYAKSLEVDSIGLIKSPRNAAFNRLALYNYVELKQTDKAIAAADRLFNKTDDPEFISSDYQYYGKALKANKQLDLAIAQYEKALSLDSTKTELWKDISDMQSDLNDYSKSVVAYGKFLNSLPEDKRTADLIMPLGKRYYGLGNDAKILDAAVKNSALLAADSLFGVVAKKEPTGYRGNYWRARTNSSLDPDTKLGLAKPYYEQTATLVESKADAKFNSVLVECYSYLGYFYLLQKQKDCVCPFWRQ